MTENFLKYTYIYITVAIHQCCRRVTKLMR